MHTKQPCVLVIGGAGYIGSHMVFSLARANFYPVILDHTNKLSSVLSKFEFVQGDKADKTVLHDLFNRYSFTAVMDFAAYINVSESILSPIKYYQNNVAATLNVLEAMINKNVNNYIFSSTAAVYGEPQQELINENHPINPMNVYGRSKWMVEEIIRDVAHSTNLNYAILRYFNAAGADPSGQISESHDPETHLIPILLNAASTKKKATIYGKNYPTPDGTCIRDYIHVMDLCYGHLLAMNALLNGNKKLLYNLGTGQGYSVMQVIKIVEKVTQQKLSVLEGEARSGDTAILVADSSLAQQQLGWIPKYKQLETMIAHAWQGKQNQ